jgi:hypothetical protein
MGQAVKFVLIGLLFGMLSITICDAQVLETETARLRPAGSVTAGGNFEWQTSSEGRERAVPFVVELGLLDRLELLVEPVAGTAILPKVGRHASGAGDLEVTASYLARRETPGFPALAVAGEVKLPTAKDVLIGTGKTDYAGYLIASKALGRFDFHANLGYTVIGQPPGVELSNIVGGALAGEYFPSDRMEFYAEVLGNTSTGSGGEGTKPEGQGAVSPEATGGELVGTLGAGVHLAPSLLFSLSLSYDNNSALLIRPGLTWALH